MQERPELTLADFVAGRKKALENARALVREAKALLGQACCSRALFLAQIAGEEVGKYLLLSSSTYRFITGELRWKSFWKSFRSHGHKLESVMLAEILLTPGTDAEEKSRELAEMKNMAHDLEYAKQLSLYVDYIDGAFRLPASLINEKMARDAVAWAEGRIAMTRRIEEVYTYKAPEDWTEKDIAALKAAMSYDETARHTL